MKKNKKVCAFCIDTSFRQSDNFSTARQKYNFSSRQKISVETVKSHVLKNALCQENAT